MGWTSEAFLDQESVYFKVGDRVKEVVDHQKRLTERRYSSNLPMPLLSMASIKVRQTFPKWPFMQEVPMSYVLWFVAPSKYREESKDLSMHFMLE